MDRQIVWTERQYGETDSMERQTVWRDRQYRETDSMDRQTVWTDRQYGETDRQTGIMSAPPFGPRRSMKAEYGTNITAV